MTSKVSDIASAIKSLQQLTKDLDKDTDSSQSKPALIPLLEQLGSIVLDPEQRAHIGADPNFSKSISDLWNASERHIKSGQLDVDLVKALARVTRNVAAGCPENQLWIASKCELSIRRLLHFLTSFYNSQVIEYPPLTTLLVQCLANTITANEKTSRKIWLEYMDFTEQENILTRLLAYPEQSAVSATLVFILNSLVISADHSVITAQSVGGRATFIALLDMADRIFEDEDKTDHFHLIFNIVTKVVDSGSIDVLYSSLHPPDDTISPHQITLLKLLDAYTQSPEYSWSPPINPFLSDVLLSLLRTANLWMGANPANTQPNENLPPVATAIVLISQMLTNALMAEQVARERLRDKNHRGQGILENLKDTNSSFAELVVDALRHLDLLLPRIQFGKVKPQFPSSPSSDRLISPDVSGFQYLKRDLVRLLGIIVYDDKRIQDQIREYGGVQVILRLCAVDERNPYIREHALFALRNLLYGNKENQDIVRELEPMGRFDENGVLTDLR